MPVPTLALRILSGALAIASIGALGWSLRGPKVEAIVPLPSGAQAWNSYDDRSGGGASRCQVLASRDTFRATVRKGTAPGAYWGLEWGPGVKGNTPLDLWNWDSRDSLVFRWRSRHAKHQTINLCSRDPGLTTASDPLSRRYLTADLPIDRQWSRAAIALSDLTPPGWWLDLHPNLPSPRKAFLGSILVLQVGPASGTEGVDDTLEIASIERHPASRDPLLTLVAALGLAGAIGLFFLSRSSPKPSAPQAPFTPPLPRPLDTPPPDLERLHRFLADNYAREDLDLAKVAKETLLSERRVTGLLSGSGESFKSVLNRLRLQEAHRLLQATDLQVSEIAFKVGYGNVSHFNRLFRDRYQASPSALRQALQNPRNPVRNPTDEENPKDPPPNA